MDPITMVTNCDYLKNLIKFISGDTEIIFFEFSEIKSQNIKINTLLIGLNKLTNEEWSYLDKEAKSVKANTKYLICSFELDKHDKHKLLQYNFSKIINDLTLINCYKDNLKSPIDFLINNHQPPLSPMNDSLIYLGFQTYFNPKEIWVRDSENPRNLSDREYELLMFFIEKKGRIVKKRDIIKHIWNNTADDSSVSVLINRLRGKLGKASKTIQGRKQGGYIFKPGE